MLNDILCSSPSSRHYAWLNYLDLTVELYPKLVHVSISNSIAYKSVISLEEDEGVDEHYVGYFSVIEPNMSIQFTLLRAFNRP